MAGAADLQSIIENAHAVGSFIHSRITGAARSSATASASVTEVFTGSTGEGIVDAGPGGGTDLPSRTGGTTNEAAAVVGLQGADARIAGGPRRAASAIETDAGAARGAIAIVDLWPAPCVWVTV